MRNNAQRDRDDDRAVILYARGGYQVATYPPFASVIVTQESRGYTIKSMSFPAGVLAEAAAKYSTIMQEANPDE